MGENTRTIVECEMMKTEPDSSKQNLMLLLIVCGVVVLVAIAVFIMCFMFHRQKKKAAAKEQASKYNYINGSTMSFGGSSMTLGSGAIRDASTGTIERLEKQMKDSSTSITETLTKSQIQALAARGEVSASNDVTDDGDTPGTSKPEDVYSTENESESYESMERLQQKEKKNWKNKHKKEKRFQKISKSMNING